MFGARLSGEHDDFFRAITVVVFINDDLEANALDIVQPEVHHFHRIRFLFRYDDSCLPQQGQRPLPGSLCFGEIHFGCPHDMFVVKERLTVRSLAPAQGLEPRHHPEQQFLRCLAPLEFTYEASFMQKLQAEVGWNLGS